MNKMALHNHNALRIWCNQPRYDESATRILKRFQKRVSERALHYAPNREFQKLTPNLATRQQITDIFMHSQTLRKPE